MPSNSIKPELESVTITVVGKFNPAIFHPSWFSKIQMFSETEIAQALTEFGGVVHRDMADFQIDWCRFIVEPQRIIISTKMDAYFERLRDLVHATFTELHHTPINAVGINPEGDFKAPSKERWHSFGDKLAPKENWSAITQHPGLRSLVIEDQPRADNFTGRTWIKIEPSSKKEIENGIYIHMNDHFSFEDSKFEDGTKHLLKVLEEGFPSTMKRWKQTHEHLTSLI